MQMASRSSNNPTTAGYLVLSSHNALIHAILLWSGVGKSGSPADDRMISLPWRSSSDALAETTDTSDAFTLNTCSATNDVDFSCLCSSPNIRLKRLLD